MNKQTRSQLSAIVQELNEHTSRLDELKEMLESIRDEEQEKLDNLEEHFSATERYAQQEEVVEHLDSVYYTFDVDCLSDVIDELQELL